MERHVIFVVFMEVNHPIGMVLKEKREEVDLKSQVIIMRIGLSCYQI
jgi:hypothetical protein